MNFGNFGGYAKEKSKILYYTNICVFYCKYITLDSYFLLLMLHILLLNKCVVIDHANISFRSTNHTLSLSL
jgi:hypothetical protein